MPLDADVAIVGAGPIGLELAVALKQAGVDYIQFDAGQVAQTVSRYPRQTKFFSSADRIAIAGVPLGTSDQSKATREQYLAYLRNIVQLFGLDVRTYEKVVKLDPGGDAIELETRRAGVSHTYKVSKVVLAVGDMARPRLLHIPGEDLAHVSHYFEEPHKYFHMNLLIVGGKNSAVEAAIRCHHAGARVTISYRREEFDAERVKYWLLPELQALIRTGKITFLPNTVPETITPDHVTLVPAGDLVGDQIRVDADFVLLLTGYEMDTELFEMAGVELEGRNRSPAFNPDTMRTNVPGVYVVGTAAAGTQETFRLFIENCHIHVKRVTESITAKPFTSDWANTTLPEGQPPES